MNKESATSPVITMNSSSSKSKSSRGSGSAIINRVAVAGVSFLVLASLLASSSSAVETDITAIVPESTDKWQPLLVNRRRRRRRNLRLREDRKGFFRSVSSGEATEQKEEEEEDVDTSMPLRPEPRIIGGSRVDNPRTRFPYYALMNGKAICGAVLVGRRFVVTAAHCAYADDDFELGTVSRQTDFLSSLFGGGSGDGVTYDWKKGRIYPQYDDGDVSHDIAVFELESLVPSSVATPVKMRREPLDSSAEGAALTVIGFGDTDASSQITDTSEYLQEVQLAYVPQSQCSRRYGSNWFTGSYIEDGMMCAFQRGRDSCGGDSGGPLLLKGRAGDGSQDELVGLVSWGISCADDEYPGVYTRISYYWDWIQDTVCEFNPDPAGLPEGMTCAPTTAPQPSSPVASPTRAPVYVPAPQPTAPAGSGGDNSWENAYDDFINTAVDWVCSIFGC